MVFTILKKFIFQRYLHTQMLHNYDIYLSCMCQHSLGGGMENVRLPVSKYYILQNPSF